MRSIIIAVLLALGVASAFSACERNDYQHPLHRK